MTLIQLRTEGSSWMTIFKKNMNYIWNKIHPKSKKYSLTFQCWRLHFFKERPKTSSYNSLIQEGKQNQLKSVYPSGWLVDLSGWGEGGAVAQWCWLAFSQFSITLLWQQLHHIISCRLGWKNKTSTSSSYPCTLIFLEVDLKASASQMSMPVSLCIQDFYLTEKIFPIYN